DKVTTVGDLPEITLSQIKHFFEHYKDLEPGKWVRIDRFADVDEAKQLVVDCIARENATNTKAAE
ncbi:MAG: inorganic diphosphatase, partial [Pseudomonadota bacterium]